MKKIVFTNFYSLIPVATRSKAWVCGRSLAETAGSNPTGGYGCLSIVTVACCQVEVSATGRSLVQRSPTECVVCVCVCVCVSLSVIRCNNNPLHLM